MSATESEGNKKRKEARGKERSQRVRITKELNRTPFLQNIIIDNEIIYEVKP